MLYETDITETIFQIRYIILMIELVILRISDMIGIVMFLISVPNEAYYRYRCLFVTVSIYELSFFDFFIKIFWKISVKIPGIFRRA